ncbi:peptide-methionine (S)-S-oxide reductase MsrA [Methanobacterium petrolearium]|uniref:peptide-methionine (S)-S-oxide reductase MsrA n=1 Tax=Methanobacterium petrolearium TaxID=710190 RepID=UPI001AE2275E|nr:peptide-methionine (S)-S-oxide reductase MsrA [Methanobacterium petrolearium]MBP1945190.1 peptide-methionine (S)-S-oxide reductase [Methanobacterium petrolearium]BDZ71119.1 peptide-methionine (S)-S-oxide reductase [Methanobacterium petrolearium]
MDNEKVEKATFGAGCFWGVEDAFRKLDGVVETAVGYAGGNFEQPSYQDVCTGVTGHAEVVEVTYNPTIISYSDLLDFFWNIHDPTTRNRQGPDVGAQYRSVIFYHTPEQGKLAHESKKNLDSSGRYPGKIVTEILPAPHFWKAEEYHQQYMEKTGQKSCRF